VTGPIQISLGPAVVHEEEHLPAHRIEPRPARGRDRLVEGRAAAAHVVGRDDLVLREDGADLLVDVVQIGRAEDEGHGEAERHGIGDLVLLQLDEDRDRQVTAMRIGPALHRLEALDERDAGGLEVDVLHVQDLEPGLLHGGDTRVGVSFVRMRMRR
jgi:hypothetical protein